MTLTHNSRNHDFAANYYGGTGNDLVLVWKKTRLISWGQGGKQLGDDPEITQGATIAGSVDTPAGQLSGRTILQVTSGGAFALALCSDGTLLAWGEGFYGTLGNGTTTPNLLPTPVNQTTGGLAGKHVVSVSSGDQHVMALCSDGSVVAWGNNTNGQVDDGSTTRRDSPVLINGGALAGKSVLAISAGGFSFHGSVLRRHPGDVGTQWQRPARHRQNAADGGDHRRHSAGWENLHQHRRRRFHLDRSLLRWQRDRLGKHARRHRHQRQRSSTRRCTRTAIHALANSRS